MLAPPGLGSGAFVSDLSTLNSANNVNNLNNNNNNNNNSNNTTITTNSSNSSNNSHSIISGTRRTASVYSADSARSAAVASINGIADAGLAHLGAPPGLGLGAGEAGETAQSALAAASRALLALGDAPAELGGAVPGVGDLPAAFGLDAAATVLVYNLPRQCATRPDVVMLLSGCSVAINENFESKIEFVHDEHGGISALVELSSAFDVQHALLLTGKPLAGQPVYIAQQFRYSPSARPGNASLAQRTQAHFVDQRPPAALPVEAPTASDWLSR